MLVPDESHVPLLEDVPHDPLRAEGGGDVVADHHVAALVVLVSQCAVAKDQGQGEIRERLAHVAGDRRNPGGGHRTGIGEGDGAGAARPQVTGGALEIGQGVQRGLRPARSRGDFATLNRVRIDEPTADLLDDLKGDR